jgi:hypothetical protein
MYSLVLGTSFCGADITGLHDPPSWLSTGTEFAPITDEPGRAHPTVTNVAPMSTAVPQAAVTKTQPHETQRPSGFAPVTTSKPEPQYISKLPPQATIGQTIVTENFESNLVIGGQTIRPGHEITYSDTVISMASDGGAIVIGGTSTQYLDPSFALGSQILSAGGPAVTAGGKTYSLLQGGSSVVVDGSTEAVSQIEKSFVTLYTIGSQTLIAGGPAITVSGSGLSLGTDGHSIVISGSVTEDVSVWLGSSGASGTARKSGSASASKSSTGGRVEERYWNFWSAVLFTILRAGEIL